MNTIPNLILIHIGKTLPEYIYDCVYQALLVNREVCIYVLLDDTLISEFKNEISKFNLDVYRSNVQQVIAVPLSIIQSDQLTQFDALCKKLPTGMVGFRDGFWISTTSRFFYIQRFMELFQITNAFHMENDIMLYEDLASICNNLDTKFMYMVQDNPKRVIPSIIYIPNDSILKDLTTYILQKYDSSSGFLNDMDLLGTYLNKKHFPFTFENNAGFLIFDGAAIGQYLGGVDPNNLPTQPTEREEQLKRMNNPSKGFVNESSVFKITNGNPSFFRKDVFLEHLRVTVQLIYAQQQQGEQHEIKQVANLHIHSKQLYQFSSIFNMKYNDIITGDRVLSLCDFVITTPGIANYHQGVQHPRMIMVRDFKSVNPDQLNQIFKMVQSNGPVKLFIYTHILEEFVKYILPLVDPEINFVFYLHNSDHPFNMDSLLENKQIKHIFAQNPDTSSYSKKVTLLPIGLANSMFKHGDILSLYSVMAKSYLQKKTKNIYININPSTFSYRAEVLKYLSSQNITDPKPFADYLADLSEHRFCLCIRGNGLDSHRFFESLYLGTIPVIINNSHTKMDSFVLYLRASEIPFIEIREESMEIISQKYFETDFFNEKLYKKMIKTPLQCMEVLKLNYYQLN